MRILPFQGPLVYAQHPERPRKERKREKTLEIKRNVQANKNELNEWKWIVQTKKIRILPFQAPLVCAQHPERPRKERKRQKSNEMYKQMKMNEMNGNRQYRRKK